MFILHFFEKYYIWWIQMCKRQMWPLVQCCVNILSFNRESQERQEIAVFDLWLPQNCSSLWRLLKTYRRKKKLACLLVYRTTGWGRLKLKYLWASVQEYFYCLSTRYVIDSFHLCLFDFPFIYQFYSIITTLVKSTCWNPADLFIFK